MQSVLLRKLAAVALFAAILMACNLAQQVKKGIEAAAKPTVLTSADGKYQLTIPAGWRADSQLHDDAGLKASNRIKEAYVVVISESREDFTDDMTLESFTKITRDAMLKNLGSPDSAAPTPTVIGDYPALRYELQGVVSNVKVIYINTTVETPSGFHQILAWTLPSRLNQQRNVLQEVTGSFREIGAGASRKGTPSPPSMPARNGAKGKKE
ncbi:MAG: hypothetical protein H0W76_17495 [Pyrinomonadaceae bacterium]|nr:hypothetical protein [Pyrinomonadaceae bacterium]